MVQKVTIYPSYSSSRTMPPVCCPCAANSIISLPFWKTYTDCLLSKGSNTRCCSSLIKLCMVKPRHISHSSCLCVPQPGLCDQRTNISSECQDAALKAFGRRCFTYAALSLWNPLPTLVKRASSIDTFKSSLKIYLFNAAYRSIQLNLILYEYILCGPFLVFLFTSAFEHGDFLPFLKLALYNVTLLSLLFWVKCIR